MLRIFIFISLLLPLWCFSQVNDDFSDGNFTSSPEWSGTIEKFTVNSNGMLQLSAPAETSEAWLFTQSKTIENAHWSCRVILGFNPSSNNLTRIYLTADAAAPAEIQNAIFVEIGQSTDEVSLYCVTGNEDTKLIDGADDMVDLSTVDVLIDVKREGNTWTLKSNTGNGWNTCGSCNFSPAVPSSYFGIYCKYTSTRSTKFYFDDFVVTGDPFTDIPPVKRFDLVFSEFMPDPSPSAGLPESEYIELFNRSQTPVNLAGWKVIVNDKISDLEAYDLQPENYVLLIPQNKEDIWEEIPNKILLSHWQALTNEGCSFVLVSGKGNVIDALQYSFEQWNDGSFKQDGGWSFERVDMNNMSGSTENWLYSVDPDGGTPGTANSVKHDLPDRTAPEITMISYEDPKRIKIYFPEPMDILNKDLTNNFKIKGNSVTVNRVIPDTVFMDNCSVEFNEEMTTNRVHEFSGITLSDLEGNKLYLNTNRFFGKPDTISASGKDILINEILFNPRPSGYDFVELINNSQKIFSIHDLRLAESDEQDKITKLFELSGKNILIFPGDLTVFTRSEDNIDTEYFCPVPEHLYQTESFPSMPDKKGTVTLTTYNGKIIDRLHYDASMHFPLLNDKSGISLERISPDMETDDPDNWSSASADYGYATPTGTNSQFKEVKDTELNGFSIEEESFTPDGDGYSDRLMIDYSFDQSETVANVTVYNSKGIPVKQLANNRLLGTKGFITWDGTNDEGKFVPPGIYLILATTYNLSGKRTTQKLTCVVGTRSVP